jgi:hypothetical protein
MRPDVVSFAKMVDPVPDLENDAGTLVAHHVRRRDSRPGWVGAIAGVDGIGTRGFDANADIACSERLSRQPGQLKSIKPGRSTTTAGNWALEMRGVSGNVVMFPDRESE